MPIYGNIVGGIDEKIAVDTSLSVSGAAADAKATGDKIAKSVEGLATETFVTNKIAEAELSGSDVDLSGYVTKDELTTLKYAGSSSAGGAATSANSLNCIEITEGTDLNTLTTPGFYRCKSNATAESLTNCPTVYAFFMVVGAHTGNGVFQELTTHHITGMRRYMRNYYEEWGNWIEEQPYGNLSLSYVGTEIPDSSDLNSYISSGRYYCLTAASAATLTNCPITDAGFTLVVMNSNNGRYQQFLFGYQNRHIYYRGSYSTTSWQDWTDLSKTTLSDLGITATATELNYVDGVTSNIQTQLDNKAPSGYGLGATSAKYCTDANTATTIGFYELAGANALNTPTGNYKYGVMLVERRQNTIYQTIRYQNSRAIRYSSDGGTTWEDWEILDDEVVMDLKNLGESITASSDLNTYTTPGNYYSDNSTISSSLTNTPITSGGFRLIVMNSYTGNTHQYIYGNSNNIYFRTKTGTDTWSDWVNLSSTPSCFTVESQYMQNEDGSSPSLNEVIALIQARAKTLAKQNKVITFPFTWHGKEYGFAEVYLHASTHGNLMICSSTIGTRRYITTNSGTTWKEQTIPISSGGTGGTTVQTAFKNLLTPVPAAQTTMGDGAQILFKTSTPSDTDAIYYRPVSQISDYVMGNGRTAQWISNDYPTKAGIYAIGDSSPIKNITQSTVYSSLIIICDGYWHTHILKLNNSKNLYVGLTVSCVEPTNWQKISDSGSYLPLAGGKMNNGSAMSFGISTDNRLISYSSGGINVKASSTGGWAVGLNGLKQDGTTLSSIGILGNQEKVTYLYLGGTMSAPEVKIVPNNGLVLTSKNYGTSLPTAGTAGRIFFKKV